MKRKLAALFAALGIGFGVFAPAALASYEVPGHIARFDSPDGKVFMKEMADDPGGLTGLFVQMGASIYQPQVRIYQSGWIYKFNAQYKPAGPYTHATWGVTHYTADKIFGYYFGRDPGYGYRTYVCAWPFFAPQYVACAFENGRLLP